MLQGQTLTVCSRGRHPGWGLPCKQLLRPHPKTARVLLPHLTELHMEPQRGRELIQNCVCFRSEISSSLVSLLAVSSSLILYLLCVLLSFQWRSTGDAGSSAAQALRPPQASSGPIPISTSELRDQAFSGRHNRVQEATGSDQTQGEGNTVRYICLSPGYGVSIIIYIYFPIIISMIILVLAPVAENLLGAMHSAKHSLYP